MLVFKPLFTFLRCTVPLSKLIFWNFNTHVTKLIVIQIQNKTFSTMQCSAISQQVNEVSIAKEPFICSIAECHLCRMSQISHLCCMPLPSVSLCWMSLRRVSWHPFKILFGIFGTFSETFTQPFKRLKALDWT